MTDKNLQQQELNSLELIKKRMSRSNEKLLDGIQKLNKERESAFKKEELTLRSTLPIKSKLVSLPSDMISDKDHIVVGYSVDKTIKVELEDVFSYYLLNENNELELENLDQSFIYNNKFKEEFDRLYRFYDKTQFKQFLKTENSIIIVFSYSDNPSDLKSYRWTLNREKNYIYQGEMSLEDVLSMIRTETHEWNDVNLKDLKEKKVFLKEDIYTTYENGKFVVKNNIRTLFLEEVKEKKQTIDDVRFALHKINDLTLIKFSPYGEKERFYIFDAINMQVVRCDGVENNIVELPQENGILFSNGYYLNSGEMRIFDGVGDANYLKTIKSPNGEDFMFLFYNENANNYLMYFFNLVEKNVVAPIKTNGFSLTDKGHLLLIKDHKIPNKDHHIQLWDSAYCNDQFYQEKQKNKVITRVDKIGNNELVNAISGMKNVVNFIETKEVSFEVYSSIIKMIDEILDVYHWLPTFNDMDLINILNEEKKTANLVLEEFKKIQELKVYSQDKLNKVSENAKEVFSRTMVNTGNIDHMMKSLIEVKKVMGEISSLKEERYISQSDVEDLLVEAERYYSNVNNALATLLNNNETYESFEKRVKELKEDLTNENNYKFIVEINKQIEELTNNISVLNEEIGSINFEDNKVFSEILEKIALVISSVNQLNALGKNKENRLALEEAKVEFASQSKLLEQTLENAITKSTTIDKTEEEYAKITTLMQALETRFSHIGNGEFSDIIESQKNEIISSFATHRKNLRNQLQEKIDNLKKSASVSLKTIENKADKLYSLNDISTLFLTDGIVLRTKKMIEEMSEHGDITSSEDFNGQLIKIQKQAIKRVRDDNELFEENGQVLKLGDRRFAVNKRPFEIVLVKNNGKIYSHIETTKYYKEIDLGKDNADIYQHWDYDVISESKDLYRSEFLAYSILQAVKEGEDGLSQSMFEEVVSKGTWKNKTYTLLNLINERSSKLFREGYIKGVHDVDAEKIIRELHKVYSQSTDVKFSTEEKLSAIMLYSHMKLKDSENNIDDIKKGLELLKKIGSFVLVNKVREKMKSQYGESIDLNLDVLEYLAYQVESNKVCSEEIEQLFNEMSSILDNFLKDFIEQFKSNKKMSDKMKDLTDLKLLIKDFCEYSNKPISLVNELVLCFLRKKLLDQNLEVKSFNYTITVDSLVGSHSHINENGQLILTVEDFNQRNKNHREKVLPVYNKVDETRKMLLKRENEEINLASLRTNPLASFVKNKLISESYLPKFGANFAKQIGETGKNKKSDTMGMLLLTSPPGYGKTTLVEYVVDKLGMLFVKINCPSIGHEITSLDPSEAKSLTARKEVEKINFAFEMGDNVCLYLDDIQHTSPEFLQKFISLCDGTRTIDGVWDGKSKTYNLRGRRFCVIMAGNPYTESGEMFKIPDMLANRADTYNLGEISSDERYVFELSYIENALTSNSITMGLMDKSAKDVYLFLKQIEGVHVDNDSFDNKYSESEANEIRKMLKIMRKIQKTILKVNAQYIISASQSDEYRVEPAFKLQGSYRNMSKIMEKALPLMTDEEIDALIVDHYQSEAQTLTNSNEENLLKFKEIFGNMNNEDENRWNYLKSEFMKGKRNADQESIAQSLEKISASLEVIQNTRSSLLLLADENDLSQNKV